MRGSTASRGASPSRGGGTGRPRAARPATKASRDTLGGTQIEGRQAVRELLLAGRRRVHQVFVASDVERGEAIDDIIMLAGDRGVPVRRVPRRDLERDARSEAPQGVLARAEEIPEAELADFVSTDDGPPFIVAVDGVTDPGNLGAILRCCEAAGVRGVVLPRHRAVHVTPTVAKAAAGAAEYVPMALVAGLPTALRQMKEAGLWVVGLDDGGSTSLFDLGSLAREPLCLVLGAEGAGLSRLVRERCDQVVGIPMAGSLASLNVSAAAALAVYEVARARRA